MIHVWSQPNSKWLSQPNDLKKHRHIHTSVSFMDIKQNFDLVVAEHHSQKAFHILLIVQGLYLKL